MIAPAVTVAAFILGMSIPAIFTVAVCLAAIASVPLDENGRPKRRR